MVKPEYDPHRLVLRGVGAKISSTNEPWFVAERSEALAGVLLTSHGDVRVRDERKRDGGLDFLVEMLSWFSHPLIARASAFIPARIPADLHWEGLRDRIR